MKTVTRILTISTVAILCGFSFEQSAVDSQSSSALPQNHAAEEDPALIQRMRKQQEKIGRRLGISAPLDASETTNPVTGIDAVQELHDSGFIIPATLEEVETALRAAASTPDPEDDKAALILKHRGSYRFYLNR